MAEAPSMFPLSYYEKFLRRIVEIGIETVTFKDLFKNSNDYDYENAYPSEYLGWLANIRGTGKRVLLIQHDIDAKPSFTKRMVELEMAYGVRSNIFMFVEPASPGVDYDVDHDFFLEAQGQGFVIGYHQNALSLTKDPHKAIARYADDVKALRRIYNIRFVVPHGGERVNGMINADLPIPEEINDLRWVYNTYGLRFAERWSDGGLLSMKDPARLEKVNILTFLEKIKPETRARCLVHPQYWGLNVNPDLNPLISRQKWYQDAIR